MRFYAGILEVHHQGKSGAAGEQQNEGLNQMQEELEHRLRIRFLHSEELFLPQIAKKDQGSIGALLLGIVILSDWIASSDYFAQAETWFTQPDAQEHAERLTVRFLDASGLAAQAGTFGSEFHSVWPNIPVEGMRGVQKEVELLFQQVQERISPGAAGGAYGGRKDRGRHLCGASNVQTVGEMRVLCRTAHSGNIQSNGRAYAHADGDAPFPGFCPIAAQHGVADR